jgi:hypothetical protein
MQLGFDDENEYETVMGKPLDKYPFVCLFSWRYNPLWLYFYSPSSGL